MKLYGAARAVAVHDDDLRRAGRLRAAHGGVDLLGVEDAALVVELLAAGRLLPLDDPGDALHVADHVNAHGGTITSRRGDGTGRKARPRDRRRGRDRLGMRARVRGRRRSRRDPLPHERRASRGSRRRDGRRRAAGRPDRGGRGRRAVRGGRARARRPRRLRGGRRLLAARGRAGLGAFARALGGDAAREPHGDLPHGARVPAHRRAHRPRQSRAGRARPPADSARPATPTMRPRRRRSRSGCS